MTPYSKKSSTHSTKRLARHASSSDSRPSLSASIKAPSAVDKPYPAWRCEQTPSRIHQLLMLSTGLGSAIAVIVASMAIVAQLACLCLLAMFITRQWRKSRAFYIFEHHGGIENSINEWSVTSNRGDTLHGKLLHKGYRSAGLLVMVFLASDGHSSYTVPVWRDTVSASAYSYLNMQLMFNTYKPAASEKMRFRR